jgi:hypothetical protein
MKTKLLVEISETDELIEAKLSSKKDRLVERVRNGRIIPKSKLEPSGNISKEFSSDVDYFEKAKEFIRGYIKENNFDYVEVSTDLIHDKELHLYLNPYMKK